MKHSSKGFCFKGNFKNIDNLTNPFNITKLHNLVFGALLLDDKFSILINHFFEKI